MEVLGTRRSQTLTDVPVAAWRSQAVWCGLLSPGLGVSAAADPPLPGELLASWIATLHAFQISSAKRPSSGAMAVGMARLGGFDPEIPVQNRTRQFACIMSPLCRSGRLLQSNRTQTNGRLQRWPMDRHRCVQPPACGRAGVPALIPALKRPAPDLSWSGRLWHDLRLKAAGGGGRRQGVRNSLTTP